MRRDATKSDGPVDLRFGDDWWRRGVIYQIYPRSFADSDGDGTGDLPDIIEHLDHLGPTGLGVDSIWLSPIHPSPGYDIGCDVSDHAAINPRFGSDADLNRLDAESARSRDPDLARPGHHVCRARARSPNDWVSWFARPAWTFDPVRGQFFHRTFLAEQPEVDWRVPAVEALHEGRKHQDGHSRDDTDSSDLKPVGRRLHGV